MGGQWVSVSSDLQKIMSTNERVVRIRNDHE